MIELEDGVLSLQKQSAIAWLFTLSAMILFVLGTFYFPDVQMALVGLMCFSLAYPLALLITAGWLLQNQLSIEKQLEDSDMFDDSEDIQEMVEDMSKMFEPVEEDLDTDSEEEK